MSLTILRELKTKQAVMNKAACIVLNEIDNKNHPYAVHFRDAQGNLHHGQYCENLEQAQNCFLNRK